MVKRQFFTILLLFISISGFAQSKKEFATDPNAFASDIRAFFTDSRDPDAKQTIEKFLQFWQTGGLTDDEKNRIIETSNAMLRQRIRLNPEFMSYYNMLNAYKEHNRSSDKFVMVQEIITQLIAKSKKDLRDFTDAARTLFAGQSIYDIGIKSWKVSSDQYTFSFLKNEPIVTFPSTDLQLFTKADTLSIYQTSGTFFPLTQKWIGKGGLVFWTRVGFDKDRASAKIKRYKLDVRESDYLADSVELSFPKVFAKPVIGRLQDKATTEFLGVKASYPRFQSYQTVLSLKNIFPSIDYKGGFTLEGPQILGTGTDSSQAVLTIRFANKPAMRAVSRSFVIDPDKISSAKAAVSIYIDKDSVYHNQLYFTYVEKTRTVQLSRDTKGLYASPFFNSYHQLEFETGNIIWKIDEPEVKLRSIANPDQATTFASASNFSDNQYSQIQGLLDYNALDKIKKFVDDRQKQGMTKTQSRTLMEDDLKMLFSNNMENLHSLLFLLANKGYIFYDFEGRRVTVKDKLMHYVSSAKKVEDYDNIQFESVITAKPNAVINLATFNFELEGVQKVNISDSQYTYLVPSDQKIVIKKNRDISFAGQVHSGRFDFWGKDLLFNYDKFNFTLTNLDSVKFKYPEYDKKGNMVGLRTIQSTIQNVNGFLYIDEPNNKSGMHPKPEYPIFDCKSFAYVYYEKPQIYNKVYKKENFFFKINPFVVQNLDKFTAEGLQFPGSFTSADILPVIQKALTIQEDFSLGFITASPATGYPLYKNKGKGSGTFFLSNKGLRASGEVDYLVSKTSSDNFIFFPDSMNSHSQSFEIQQLATGKYPPVSGKDVKSHWKPYHDSMYVYQGKTPLSVYNGKIDFSGDLILTPAELVGTGKMKYQNLNVSSTSFAFLPKNIKTNAGEVRIKDNSGSKDAVVSTDTKVDVDLTKDFGKFEANKDTSKVALTANRFSTTLNKFTYDINKKEVNFVKHENQSDDDAYFVSNNPEQQQLKFMSKKASLNLNESEITAEDVPFILVADSKIFPPKNQIKIQKEGNIGSLKGADIVTSKDLQYHKIYNAFVNIFSQSKFTGYGDYDYLDKNKKKFRIHFNDIRTTDDGKTTAKGVIADTANFFITPSIRYNGNVALLSVRKELAFDGFILPDHKMTALNTQWIKVSDTVDAYRVNFDLRNPVGKDGKPLFTGTYIAKDSNKIYNVFFGKLRTAADKPVFTTSGSFVYDEAKSEYIYGAANKVQPSADGTEGPGQSGNIFILNSAKGTVYTEGAYDFGMNLKNMKFAAAGDYLYKYADRSNLFNLVMLVDFALGDDATKIMTDSLTENTFSAPDTKNNDERVLNAFASLVPGRKERQKILDELTSSGFVPVTDEVNKLFVFTEVKLSYVDSTNSFISKSPIGLANSHKVTFNKRMDGVIELKDRGEENDVFSMLLESKHGSFHYFSYIGNTLYYLSSDYIFDDKVTETKAKTEKAVKGGYRLSLGTVNQAYDLKLKGDYK